VEKLSSGINFDIANIGKELNTSKYATKSNDSLGKDDFLQLLVTQLKYQDPLKPMDDKEFIGQMAQFSSLEQMTNLNNSFVTNKAMALMGKYVEGTIEENGQMVELTGNVESIRVAGTNAFAVVNGKDMPMENIYQIMEPKTEETTSIGSSDYINISEYKGLIGSKVNSIVSGIEEDSVYTFSGNVQSIKVIGNQTFAVINGIEGTIDSIALTEQEQTIYASLKAYLEDNIGNKVSATILNENGETTKITGIVNAVAGDDDKPNVIFDNINTPIDNIYEMF